MKEFFKKTLVLLLALTLAIPAVNGVEAKAASKPTLSSKKMTIGIGSYGDTYGAFHKTETKYKLTVENQKKGASYTFTSSNKKVVTVKTSKNVGYLTGVKAGSANITVKQKLKGKTTTVGKCKVTVKKTTVSAGYMADSLAVGCDVEVGNAYSLDSPYSSVCVFKNYNPSAKYTYESNSKNFKMSQKKVKMSEDANSYFGYIQKYTATEPGTYTVTVKETYKKKTRKVGTVQITVYGATIAENQPEIKFGVGDEFSLSDLIQYGHSSIDGLGSIWLADVAEDGILEIVSDYDATLRAAKTGTTELKFYMNKNGEFGDFLGSVKVVVEEVEVLDINVDDLADKNFYVNWEDSIKDYVSVVTSTGGYYNGDITFTSLDENVIKVAEDGSCTPVAEGKATIIITAGDITKEAEVTVVKE